MNDRIRSVARCLPGPKQVGFRPEQHWACCWARLGTRGVPTALVLDCGARAGCHGPRTRLAKAFGLSVGGLMPHLNELGGDADGNFLRRLAVDG